MVGGVSPGKGGQEHLGLPVFNSVAEVLVHIRKSIFFYQPTDYHAQIFVFFTGVVQKLLGGAELVRKRSKRK